MTGQWEVCSSTGTPDLVWQGPLDYEEDDPDEQDAARLHWEEGKAGPGAACRMASTGRSGRQTRAAVASSGRVEVWVLRPPTPWPGRSNVRAPEREEVVSEGSLEEGELRNSGSETEWWERKGQGAYNPVRQSLQVKQAVTRTGGRRKERMGAEARTVQEQPPLLSPASPAMLLSTGAAGEGEITAATWVLKGEQRLKALRFNFEKYATLFALSLSFPLERPRKMNEGSPAPARTR
ncbi:hypothetical protein NDU88_002843 [Pleurodeles waltl]|uniref:Uncharacterized protein n=1 Tax=Pleurodeles waltl TaxID=8319 RepID=A0AAV7UB16_PLEWA|nr:hypothetical protein NDU88_002843 [Pleurodeles waltl]